MSGHRSAGFSLLEVMVALAILGLGLTAISRSQQNSIRAANRSRMITVAVALARAKMIEVEDLAFEKGFSEFEEKEEGDFKEEGFDRFSYALQVEKVELPANLDAQSAVDMLGGGTEQKGDSDSKSSPGGMMKLGAQMLSKQFDIIRNVLEQSIRRVQLKVSWQEGTATRDITVVSYFTDPRQVDIAIGGSLGGLVPSLSGGNLSSLLGGSGSGGASGGSSGSQQAGGTTSTPGLKNLFQSMTGATRGGTP
jgi:general secretion pathway protein I